MNRLTIAALANLEPADTDAGDCGVWWVTGPIGVFA